MSASDNDKPTNIADELLEEASRVPATISKTRYMAGVQCEKRLFLEVRQPGLASETDPMLDTIRRMGDEIGQLARERYPGGALVKVDPANPGPAVVATRDLMRDASIGAIFEATVTAGGEQASIDVLERQADGSWDLVESKSSKKVKPEYLDDLSMQRRVFLAAGVDVRRVRILQPNPQYVLGKDGVDVREYFTDRDVTADVAAREAETARKLARQREVLSKDEAPKIAVGNHCMKPRQCPFYEHCHIGISAARFPVKTLYNVRGNGSLMKKLKDEGITDIRNIPDDMEGMSAKQKIQRQVARTGQPYHDHAAVEKALSGLEFPIHFLDFETIIPGIPLYPGTRPHEIMPIQFSNHTLQPNGRLFHREYLHSTDTDPREAFVKHLKRAVKDKGSIMVYSPYEEKRLRRLAETFPKHADDINAIIERFVDLLPVVQEHTYYPGFDGSYSLKKVLPVFVDDLSYKGLLIQNGNDASIAFMEMIHPDTPSQRQMEIGLGLRKYCQTDTEALLKLFYKLAPGFIERNIHMKQARKRSAAR